MLLGALAAGSWKQERGTNLLDTGAPFYDVYETADGKYVAVGALEPQFYDELIEKLGITAPDRTDQANWPELRKLLAETFAQRTQAEWTELFDGSDACVSARPPARRRPSASRCPRHLCGPATASGRPHPHHASPGRRPASTDRPRDRGSTPAKP